MAVLINGNGNEAIYAQQDADWFASIMGNQTAITAIGSKFAATLLDANTVGVADGVIITQEGRRIQLDVNEIDSFDIPAGGQGQTNYYIIGYHLVTGDLSEQYCETFVRLMDNDTDTIPEDTFRGGADEVFVSLYRVTQDDLVITDMELLLPEITNLSQLNNDLTELDTSLNHYQLDTVSTTSTITLGNYRFIRIDMIADQDENYCGSFMSPINAMPSDFYITDAIVNNPRSLHVTKTGNTITLTPLSGWHAKILQFN